MLIAMWQINWNAPQWDVLSSVATAGALVVAVLLAALQFRDRHEERRERRKDQAGRIVGWIEWDRNKGIGVQVKNHSDLPVTDVDAYVIHAENPNEVLPLPVGLVPPATVRGVPFNGRLPVELQQRLSVVHRNADWDYNPELENYAMALRFRDANDVLWERSPARGLYEVRSPRRLPLRGPRTVLPFAQFGQTRG